MFDNSNCCCDPCCNQRMINSGGWGSNIWIWVIVAIVVIWIFSDNNNNCCC